MKEGNPVLTGYQLAEQTVHETADSQIFGSGREDF